MCSEYDHQIHRLTRVQRRLQDSLDSLVAVDDHANAPAAECDDFDNDVSFLTGDFGEILDDDYLGFKNLGIHPGTVPEQFWNPEGRKSKIRIQRKRKRALLLKGFKAALTATGEISVAQQQVQQSDLIDPLPAFPPILDISSLIGLLQPFYRVKTLQVPVNELVEVSVSSLVNLARRFVGCRR